MKSFTTAAAVVFQMLLCMVPIQAEEDVICVDDPSFTFTLYNGNEKPCSWLIEQNAENRKQIYCKHGHIKGACQASCDFCPCVDTPGYKWVDDTGNLKSCEDLKDLPPHKVKEECSGTPAKRMTADYCPESCDLCRDGVPSSEPSIPPSPMPSPFPTLRPTSQPSVTPSLSPSVSAVPTPFDGTFTVDSYKLCIYSNVATDIPMMPQLREFHNLQYPCLRNGHSALSLMTEYPDGTTSHETYGLWPDEIFDRVHVYDSSGLDHIHDGKDGCCCDGTDVRKNFLGDYWTWSRYPYLYCTELTLTQLARFRDIVSCPFCWTCKYNAASFASEVFHRTTGIPVSSYDDHYPLAESPREIGRTIWDKQVGFVPIFMEELNVRRKLHDSVDTAAALDLVTSFTKDCCCDHEAYTFLNHENEMKTCSWLHFGNREKRIEHFCNVEDVRLNCPFTCSSHDCNGNCMPDNVCPDPLQWTLIADITGEDPGDYIAGVQGIEMSGDGLVLVVASKFANSTTGETSTGAVSVYELLNGVWIMRGGPIYGNDPNDEFGTSVDINHNGTVLAAGSSNGGYVHVYDWNGSAWIQRYVISGLETDAFGMGVNLNKDGNRLVIGSHLADPDGLIDAGRVTVYEWDGISWLQMGAEIIGIESNDEFGFAVDMDDSGDTIIIGSAKDSGGIGHARVFSWDGFNWIQKGLDLDDASFDVSINANGNVVVIGNPYYDGVLGNNTGSISVYEWDGNAWIMKGTPIEGSSMEDRFGFSVDINAEGNIIAAGGPGFDTASNVNDVGYVRLLQWNDFTSVWEEILLAEGEYYEDNGGTAVSLNDDGSCVAIGANEHDDYYGDNTWNNGQVRVICCIGPIPPTPTTIPPSPTTIPPSTIPPTTEPPVIPVTPPPTPAPTPTPSMRPSISAAPSSNPTTSIKPSPAPSRPPSPMPSPFPTLRPTTLPLTNAGWWSGVFGDPHLSTFDSLRFDCQAAGEFITVTSLETPQFMIQERFTAVGSSSKQCTHASVSTGFVIRDENVPVVQVSTPRYGFNTTLNTMGACPIDFFIDGEAALIEADHGHSISVSYSQSFIRIRHPSSGVMIQARIRNSASFGCFFLVQVFIPFSYRQGETILGLLGTPNSISNDDWRTREGTILSIPLTQSGRTFSEAYNYCTTQWCIRTDTDSIFTYEHEEESFTAISKCDEAYVDDLEAAVENAPQDLINICENNLVCLVDGICGDFSDGVVALEDEEIVKPTPSDSPSMFPSDLPSDPLSDSCEDTDGFLFFVLSEGRNYDCSWLCQSTDQDETDARQGTNCKGDILPNCCSSCRASAGCS